MMPMVMDASYGGLLMNTELKNEKNTSGNQMMKMMTTRRIPPTRYLTMAPFLIALS